jgi:uncharacterized protein YcbX
LKTAIVQDLFFYPIKSFRGLHTNELRLSEAGPELDRQWMLIDDKKNFLTLRQIPELAKIGLSLDDAGLQLSQGEYGSVDFGLNEREGDEFTVTVWKNEVPAFEVSSEVSGWLSDLLKKNVRLVRISENSKRGYAELPERTIRFVDQRPLLVISRASLEQLEKKAGITIAMSRFRPNIVVNQVPAHAEDEWTGFKIENLEFKALKPSTRCKITCTHPLTGVVGEEPLKTLATYRRLEKGICFGYYYAHLRNGTIKLGATVSPH